ncbi:DUF975 family protein [Bifidobacterium oedipodis]|uniref:Transporter n=1 Tax=Bifidobacterium oedipodis TaxID=2675322 RepID=A0A7Y0HR28_9BIFI|nr:DUF975 family protein [Bifidobacterium sp. DSM 109957]NMM93570.1 transporter [Bifidobacterium sp. DSM 109957]
MNRKAMKQQAKTTFKRHYWILVVICLFAAFLGVQFSDSLLALRSTSTTSSASAVATAEDSAIAPTSQFTNLDDLIVMLMNGDTDEARQQVANNEADAAAAPDAPNAALGHTRGVFASLANALSSGSFLIMIINAIGSITHSASVTTMVFIVLATAVYAFVWLFIQQTYLIVMRRMTLEARTYEQVPLRRFLYPLQSGRWVSMAWTMLLTSIFRALWWLTIVGGIIKTYSYFLVPYIVAENPNIKACDAITLSRRMMRGHKWECFVAQLSFLGWILLSSLTFGLSGIFYSNGYRAAFFAEYYAHLRQLAKSSGIEGAEQLRDDYLYVRPTPELLAATYADATAAVAQAYTSVAVKPTGFTGWLARWFGICLKPNGAQDAWDRHEAVLDATTQAQNIIQGRVYPGRLAPTPMQLRLAPRSGLCPTRSYTVLNLVAMFFIFCFVGWLWEVTLALITEGMFVNRGTLHGPWLPIYGTGGIIILVLLRRLRDRPALLFVGAVVLCGTLEYCASWYLEVTHDGQRWWDYSGYFLNLNGRICAEGLLVFGLGGLAITYLLAPVLDNLLSRANRRVLGVLAIVLLVLYCADQAYSSVVPNIGAGITDYKGSSTSQTA